MSTEFQSYEEAYAHAIDRANRYRQAHGIEKQGKPYTGYTVKMIPNSPANRFGWEMRCQAVEPGTPLSVSQTELLRSQGIEIAPMAGRAA